MTDGATRSPSACASWGASSGPRAISRRSRGATYLEANHLREALQRARSIEEQIRETYGSFQGGLRQEVTESQRQSMGYYNWNDHPDAGSFPRRLRLTSADRHKSGAPVAARAGA